MNNHKKPNNCSAEENAALLRQLEQWQDAYLRQSHDAALGRLFRGTIHNLNGIIQAFSMQAELLGMMFDQAEVMLRYMLARTEEPEIKENLVKLHELLARRTVLVEQMEKKVRLARTIVRHSGNLPLDDEQGERRETVNAIIKDELEFLRADLFFKHKVKKNLNLAGDIPPLEKYHIEMHQIFFRLLLNGLEAMRNSGEKAELTVTTELSGDKIKIAICDSGPGIPPADLEKIYDPFFTTRKDHAGVGLYVVKKLAARCGGEINCQSQPGATCFQLCFPAAGHEP